MKEIDWEQRRYEIARDTLEGLIRADNYQYTKQGKHRLIDQAVTLADMLIKELKQETDGQG